MQPTAMQILVAHEILRQIPMTLNDRARIEAALPPLPGTPSLASAVDLAKRVSIAEPDAAKMGIAAARSEMVDWLRYHMSICTEKELPCNFCEIRRDMIIAIEQADKT